MINYDWIIVRRTLKTRNLRLQDLKSDTKHQVGPNTHLFDMQSLLFRNKFIKEIQETCNWLNVDMPNHNHLDNVRKLFIENCHTNFIMQKN